MSISKGRRRQAEGGRRLGEGETGRGGDWETIIPKYRNTTIPSYRHTMITIRKASPADASVIIDFQQKMAWETEQMMLVSDVVTKGVKAVFDKSSRGQYWIAEHDNRIIASLLITYEWSDWRNANVWWFQSVYVVPEYRRQGVFRMLYSHIRNLAEEQDVAGLRLYVESKNTSAQKTYKALGMSSEHYAFYEWMRK